MGHNLYSGKPVTYCDGYSFKTFSIPSSYFGQTIQVVFRVHSDGGPKNTMFRIDDVSLTYIPCSLPLAPTGLTATPVSSSQINVSWNSVSGATDYEVDGSAGNCPWGAGATIYLPTNCNTCTNVSATGLNSNTTYRFIVSAKNSCGWGPISNCVNATTLSGGSAPVADFSASPTSGDAPLTVNFTDQSSNSPTSWNWDFGDGNNTTSQNPSHTYSNAGTYSVSLTATNSYGSSNPLTKTNYITVNSGGSAPIANFSASPTSGNAPLTVHFTDQSSNSPTSWSWSFPGGSSSSSTLQNPTITYNSAGIYDVTLTATNSYGSSNLLTKTNYITVTSVTPSQITIKNIIANNSSFPTPKTLWQGSTSGNPSIIKICADGSKATEITLINNTGINSTNIRFWIESDPNGNNSDLSGYFINYKVNGNSITAEFAHPKYLQDAYKPFRPDNIQIVDYTNPTPIIFTIPIQIYRAPVLMVHGLWGNIDSFQEMENSLDLSGYYPNLLTYRIDYYFSNSYSFSYNAGVVPNSINTLFLYCRNNNFSAGKVDLIGHSMGGLLERQYIQSANYKNDVHKFITINTPHSGSQSANFLRNPQYSKLSNIMWVYGYDDSNGAVDDLKTNSIAINNLFSNGLSANYSDIGSHSVTTKSKYFSNKGWDFLLANQAAIAAGFFLVDKFLLTLYQNEDHDLIVPMSSQQGGLNSQAISFFDNQWHCGSTENISIQNDILNLLNAHPNSSLFDHNGFNPYPFPLTSIYFKSNTDSIITQKQKTSGKITINYPSTNMIFSPGQQIQINISSNGSINHITSIEGNYSLGITFSDTSVSNAILNYTIPQNAIGKLIITAVGSDSSEIIDYDTISIIIDVIATLDSLQFYPSEIFVPVNGNSSLTLIGYFSDGITRNLNFINKVQYQIIDTNKAKYSEMNIIHGKQIGITTLFVTYQGYTSQVPITVFPQDKSIDSIISSIKDLDPNNQLSGSIVNYFNIYPNPLNSTANIEYELSKNAFVSLKIYNIFGVEVINLINSQHQGMGIHKILFNGNSLPIGMYFCHLDILPSNNEVKCSETFKVQKIIIYGK